VTDDGFTEMMDNTDEDHSNWMIFVRAARTVNEHNLIAYQEDGCIFFVSLRVCIIYNVWHGKGNTCTKRIRRTSKSVFMQCSAVFGKVGAQQNKRYNSLLRWHRPQTPYFFATKISMVISHRRLTYGELVS